MDKAYYAEKGLFIGITGIICAFYFFAPTLFTLKSSLIEISGEVEDVKIFYTQVEGSRGSKSVKSELKFSLNTTQNVYILTKNIGGSSYNERFEALFKDLKKSGKAKVWIKEGQKGEFKPTVFQIANRNGEILYDFDESKSHSRFGFLLSLGIGFLGIGLYLRHKYWKKLTQNKGRNL